MSRDLASSTVQTSASTDAAGRSAPHSSNAIARFLEGARERRVRERRRITGRPVVRSVSVSVRTTPKISEECFNVSLLIRNATDGEGMGRQDNWLAQYSAEEQKILLQMVDSRGEEFARENAALIIAQAHTVGDLVDDDLSGDD